jgi:hypothetical protein
MQNNIDIFSRKRSGFRRNMLKAKSLTAPVKIDNERPARVAVTITAHNDQRRTNPPQLIQDPFRANISQMPDLVRFFRESRNPFRKLVMGIGEDENLHGGSASPKTMLNSVRLRRLNKHRVRDNAIHLQRTSTFKHQKGEANWLLEPWKFPGAWGLELNLCVSDFSA